jgi:hypothetical protein
MRLDRINRIYGIMDFKFKAQNLSEAEALNAGAGKN